MLFSYLHFYPPKLLLRYHSRHPLRKFCSFRSDTNKKNLQLNWTKKENILIHKTLRERHAQGCWPSELPMTTELRAAKHGKVLDWKFSFSSQHSTKTSRWSCLTWGKTRSERLKLIDFEKKFCCSFASTSKAAAGSDSVFVKRKSFLIALNRKQQIYQRISCFRFVSILKLPTSNLLLLPPIKITINLSTCPTNERGSSHLARCCRKEE